MDEGGRLKVQSLLEMFLQTMQIPIEVPTFQFDADGHIINNECLRTLTSANVCIGYISIMKY